MNKKVKHLLRVGAFSLIICTSLPVISVKAEVNSDGSDTPYGTFYNDGTYEYDYGFTMQMANKDSYGRWIEYDLDNGNPNDFFNGNNRRDRWTQIRNEDRRGWSYDHSEWVAPENFSKYHKDGYNEYIWDGYNAMYTGDYIYGVQDGITKIYESDNGTMNRYRRAGIMIYKRELPTPRHEKSYILPKGNTYANGTVLWTTPTELAIRTSAWDQYPTNYGQNAQYAGNIKQNFIRVMTTDEKTAFSQHTDMTQGTDKSFQWWDHGEAGSKDAIFRSMKIYWVGNVPGSRDIVDGQYLNGIGSEMTIVPKNGQDLIIGADHKNKYGLWAPGSGDKGYHDWFLHNGTKYTLLKIDGDGPSAPTISASRKDNWGNNSVAVWITAHGEDKRSGTAYSQYRLDEGEWQTYTGTVNVSSNGWHNVHFRSIDNLGNLGSVSSVGFGIDTELPSLSNYSIGGAQYYNGTDYWVKPLTNVEVHTRWNDWVSGVSETYIRNVSWDNAVDNRRYYRWYNSTNEEFMTSNDIKIPSVRVEYNTPNVKDNIWVIQPQNAERDYYIQSAAYDFAWNLKDYTTMYRLRVDGTPPYATRMEVKNKTPDGFDLYLYGVGDARSGVASVKFPTWTDSNGQDDIVWHTAANQGGGTWYAHVNRSEHKNEFGMYTVHAYVYDNVGNNAFVGSDNFAVAAEPELGGLQVVTYDYKQSDTIYWSKLGNPIGIKTDGYFPSSYNMYPTRTYVAFCKNGMMIGESGRQYASTAGSFTWGTEYSGYFEMLSNADKAVESQYNSRNYLTATHRMKAKVDNTAFKLFHTTTYISGGNEYFKPYADSGIWLKIDGKAPTGVSSYVVNGTNLNLDIIASGVVDSGSGVKNVWAEITPVPSTLGAPLRVNLTNTSGTSNWSTSYDALATYSAATGFRVQLHYTDNVGNDAIVLDQTKDVIGVTATISPYNSPTTTTNVNLMQGQRGVIKIRTTGYMDKVVIQFPAELQALNKTMTVAPVLIGNYTYEFDVPLEAVFTNYPVTITGYKGTATKTANINFNVLGSVFDRFRTRVRY